MEPTSVRVESMDGHTYTTVLFGGEHRLLADEPQGYGGEDLGPSPLQLVLMALGSCASITLQMYARRKGWLLERVAVEVTHRVVPGEGGNRGQIERRIELTGDLDLEQRRRLLLVAGRCPVARLMKNSPEILDVEIPSGVQTV